MTRWKNISSTSVKVFQILLLVNLVQLDTYELLKLAHFHWFYVEKKC